ncbi:MAG TPA: Calx-beta domain-containing protein [Pyrinomonadaceae bacterium]
MHRRHATRFAFVVLCLCAALFGSALLPAAGSGQVKNAEFDQAVGRVLGRYDRLELDPATVERGVRRTGHLTLETSAGTFELLLAPHDVRADEYRAVEVLEGGETRELPRAPGRTFKGTLAGDAASQARFTIDRDSVEGMIIAGGEKFFVESAARYSRQAAPGDFLFYRESDVAGGDPSVCAVQTLAGRVNSKLGGAPSAAAADDPGQPALPPLSPKRQADIATEADHEYFVASGSNSTAANNEILSIMNQVDGVYQVETGITFKVVSQRVWATPNDPYDAAGLSGLLDQVRAVYTNTPPAGSENRDLVHMWTGRDLDGFQTGLAYSEVTSGGVTTRGVVCRFPQFSVGVSERLTTAPQKYVVTAHEIGHNFGATHPEATGHAECALTIMSGVAQSNTLFTFCQFSRDEITTYAGANSGCLAALTNTPTVQFSAADYRVTEGTSSVQVTVTRSSSDGASTVQYLTTDGSASERSDYTTAVGTLRFNAGETSKSFSVFITDDSYGEAPETFQVLLSNATNATLGTPNAATVTVISNEALNGPNPVKDPTFNSDFFVRQHYVDFLNREPDASGRSFWVGQTTGCGSPDPLVCRTNVSAAFFLSIEFQETGFYAIRVQRVAFGRRSDTPSTRVTYRELIRDQRQVGEGVVVGQAGYEQLLDANKNAYAAQVAADGQFAARFPQTTADAYVGALYASAGVQPSAAERQEAVNAYNAGGRAAALRRVADSNSVRAAELNTAFVLLQYHGYLRRNPTDAPNTDDSGYQFWLGKLNEFGGDYVRAEMVKAFITSDEYQRRFGP